MYVGKLTTRLTKLFRNFKWKINVNSTNTLDKLLSTIRQKKINIYSVVCFK